MFSPTRCSLSSSPFIATCFLKQKMSLSSSNRLNECCIRLFSNQKTFSSTQRMPIGSPTFAEPGSLEHEHLVKNFYRAKNEKESLTEENLAEIKAIMEEKEKIETTPILKKTIPLLFVSPEFEARLKKLETAVFQSKEYDKEYNIE